MSLRWKLFIVTTLCFLCAASVDVSAQFRNDAFKQDFQSDSLSKADTSDKLINFKEIFGGLSHKRSMRIGTMFGTSIIVPGAAQIYNKDYWKLGIFYSGIAAGVTAGGIYVDRYKKFGNPTDKTIATCSFVGAGLFYYASLMDGAVCYKSDRKRLAGRAAIYSILCPGLGQAYNGEYWKIPIYVGGLGVAVHFAATNNTNYIRYRNIYREASEPGYTGRITADQAKYYRDEYRRYRDYSYVAIGLVYLLQIIDANVFCYMNDFDVSENVTAKITPSVQMPLGNAYASSPSSVPATPTVGASFALKF